LLGGRSELSSAFIHNFAGIRGGVLKIGHDREAGQRRQPKRQKTISEDDNHCNRPGHTHAAVQADHGGLDDPNTAQNHRQFSQEWWNSVTGNKDRKVNAASAGAGILTLVTKNSIERIRPEQAQQLIVVSGFSYPSGHSLSTSGLYLTIAIIAARYVQHPGARAAILMACIGGADHGWRLTRLP